MTHRSIFSIAFVVVSGCITLTACGSPSAEETMEGAAPAELSATNASSAPEENAGSRFLFRSSSDGARAAHPAFGDVSLRGGEVSLGSGRTRVTFATEFPGATSLSERAAHTDGNTVTISDGAGVLETWTLGAVTAEQSFVVPRPLTGDETLSIRVRIGGGVIAKVANDVQVRTTMGEYSYARLHAFASNGDELVSRMRVDGDSVVLDVDVDADRYPVSIDPTISYDPLSPQLFPTSARGALLGAATTMSGTRAALGAPGYAGPAMSTVNAGNVHTYTYNSVTAKWDLETTLAVGVNANDRAGACVAMSGSTLAVGVPGDTTNTGRVAIYSYTMALGWALQASVTATAPASGDKFGEACSMLGDTLIVGAPGRMSGRGSTFAFARSGGVWIQEAEMAPSDLGSADAFGTAVALDVIGSDHFLIAGAPKNDTGATDAGAAYLFSRVSGSTTWTQVAKVQRTTPTADNQFGGGVAISGANALVSTGNSTTSVFFRRTPIVFMGSTIYTWTVSGEFDTAGGGCAISGSLALAGYRYGNAVSAYTLSGTTWTRQPVSLTAVTPPPSSASFGVSIALSGARAILGSPLADYSNAFRGGGFDAVNFVVSPYSATQLGTSFNPDAVTSGRAGAAVATDGATAVMGEPGAEVRAGSPPLTAIDQGRVYTYGIGSSTVPHTYSFQSTFTRGVAGDRFGAGVAVQGNTLAVGAPGVGGAGAVHIYTWSGTAWVYATTVTPAVPETGSDFGAAVSLTNGSLLVGAPLRDTAGLDAGAVFVFVGSGASWTQQTMLVEPSGSTLNHFGAVVAMGSNAAIVGVPDRGATDDGSAVVFRRSGTTWDSGTVLAPTAGAAGDHFGASVAVEPLADAAFAVGAPNRLESGFANNGAAFVFVPSGATFVEQKILPNTAQAQGRFGQAVALTGVELVVSQPGLDVSGVVGRGAIELRVANGSLGSGWGSPAVFQSIATTLSTQEFGGALAARSGSIVVGSPKNTFTSTVDGGAAQAITYANSLGEPCDAAAPACGIYSCVDGVCCQSACGGGNPSDCLACSIAAGGTTNGSCTPVTAAAAVVCRPSAGSCDVAETCNGAITACPPDTLAASDVVCGASAGPCDAIEYCTGASATCPANAVAPSGRVCRAASGTCDIAEACDGVSIACPADAVQGAGTVCRSAIAGGCDATETCDGLSTSCPADAFAPSGTACRASSGGVCDVAEACTGTSAACPVDGFAMAGTACRASTGMCDPAEACNGSSPSCPADVLGCCATNADCSDGDSCTTDTCTSGVCTSVAVASCCNVDAECEDGNVCTTGTCAAHACVQAPIAACCTSDGECDDSDACTSDSCAGNACHHDAIALCGVDAGMPLDGGAVDSGLGFDAGTTLDMGVSVDASIAIDGAISPDASAPLDASVMDGGVRDGSLGDAAIADAATRDAASDASHTPDADVPPDTIPPSGGCCSVAAGSRDSASESRESTGMIMLLACMLGLVAWRRRR